MPRFILSFFLLFALTAISAEANRKIILEAGRDQVVRIPPASAVTASPKNIVEVEAAGKGEIRLIGLKSGVALVKATNEDSEVSFVVEVLSRDSQGDWLLRSEWRSYFCSKKGIQCDVEQKVIAGQTDDLSWFFEARKICKSKMPCSWNVQLTEPSTFKAENDLQALYPELSFHLSPQGQLRIESTCEEKERKRLDQVIAAIEESYKVAPEVQCLLRTPDLWSIEVLVIAEREGSGEISNPLRWERIEFPSDQALQAFIAELSQDSRLRIVANPELNMSLGGTALLKDGQEIQTLAMQKDSEEILWKQSGFRLELKLLEFREGRARIKIHLNLSQPQAGLRTIDASEFATEVWIPQGRLIRIGRLKARLEGNEENRIPWLSAIPLLGALFRWESDTQAKSQVDVLLRIRQGVPSSEPPDRVGSSERESEILFPDSRAE